MSFSFFKKVTPDPRVLLLAVILVLKTAAEKISNSSEKNDTSSGSNLQIDSVDNFFFNLSVFFIMPCAILLFCGCMCDDEQRIRDEIRQQLRTQQP